MSIDRRKYMSAAEVSKLRESASKKGGLTWMVVDLALSTGLRVSEMALIKVSHIDFERGLIVVTRLKRKKTSKETMAIGLELVNHLQQYLHGRESGALFIGQRGALTAQGLQRIWKSAIKKAGLPKELSIHSARHTIAVHLLKKTKNLRQVQKQLGHASPATTANMYADVSFEDMQEGLNHLY
jgi:integrase/recombinase XerD